MKRVVILMLVLLTVALIGGAGYLGFRISGATGGLSGLLSDASHDGNGMEG